VDVILASGEWLPATSRHAGSLPDNRGHKVFRAEHLVKQQAAPVLLGVVEVQPEGAVVGKEPADNGKCFLEIRVPGEVVEVNRGSA